MRRMALSFFGAGYLRPAPGTWGSLAALPVAYLLHLLGGPGAIAVATGLVYAVGLTTIRQEAEVSGEHDPSWIVIDEVVGQWIALLPVSAGAYAAGVDVLRLWPGIIVAFLLFRLFDIWKPWLVGKADARDDASGVMLDDVWAGLFAAVGVLALAWLAHVGFVANVPDQQ
ncbi:MAG: phosphatidylglycerophosphatase A [Boseongicola sp.]|nr:phosphatidylglycerophosphatase A [Boseongicola sp.]MDD9978377.1 phosphatidylglycerophosphatase A [Boseongicola sp.]